MFNLGQRSTSYYKLNFLLIIASVLLSGCVKFLATPPPMNEESINFKIFEKFTEKFNGPHIFLSVSTKEIFGCANYNIKHSVSMENSTIKVIIDDITRPEDNGRFCLTAIEPASFQEDLNLKNGTYNLEFDSKNKIDKYSLIVSKDNVIIKSKDNVFSKPEYTKIDRIPENLLWADCFYNSDWKFNPRDDFCERFFADIKKFSKPYLIAEEGKTPKNQFYLYAGEDKPLIDLMQKYNRNGYYMHISRWKGKSFWPNYGDMPNVANVPNIKIDYLKEPATNISKCNKNVMCIMEVAFNTQNEKICEKLQKKDQGQCFGQVGIAKLDKNLCSKTDTCRTCQEECYSYIAIQKSNPNLCDEMTDNYRDDCYISYAKAKKDISFCNKIKQSGRMQWCLDNFK